MIKRDAKTGKAFIDQLWPTDAVRRLLLRIGVFVLALLVLFCAAWAIGQSRKLPVTSETTAGTASTDNVSRMINVPAAAVARGNSLVVGFSDALQIINPLFSTGDGENDAVSLIFESLVRLDVNGRPSGELAQDWTYDLATRTLAFHLQDNHIFSDGRVLDAADVVFTYSCLLSDSYNGPLQGRFAAILSVGTGATPDTVIFQLAEWVEAPDYKLFTIGILKSDYYAVELNRVFAMFETNLPPEGSGAFALTSSQDGLVVLSLRAGYGGMIRQISLRKIASQDKFQLLQDGELDIVRNVWDTRMQERADSLTGYSLTRIASSVGSYLLVNPGGTPAAVVQLPEQRLAILLTAASRGLTDLQQQAMAGLAASKMILYYFNGLDSSVQLETKAQAQALADRLCQAGLDVIITGLDWPDLAERAVKGDYDILLVPATANSRLPEQTVILADPAQPSATAWITGYQQEVFIVSNRLSQLTINPAGNPFAALAGSWTDSIENVRVLAQNGTYWQEAAP